MQKIAELIKKEAESLLKENKVTAVWAWQPGEFYYDNSPVCFTAPEQLDKLVYNEFCPSNLGKYLMAGSKKNETMAVFAKPCDTYGINQLIKDHRIKRELITVIGIPCSGMRVVRDEVQNRGITTIDFAPAIELILDEEGKASGAVLMNFDTGEYSVVRAKTVIIATGGAGRLHYQGFPTSNHYGATADGLILGYRVGAELLYQDAIQYHPTGVAYPSQIFGALVTEKVRSLGAQLINRDGIAFMPGTFSITKARGENCFTASIIAKYNLFLLSSKFLGPVKLKP